MHVGSPTVRKGALDLPHDARDPAKRDHEDDKRDGNYTVSENGRLEKVLPIVKLAEQDAKQRGQAYDHAKCDNVEHQEPPSRPLEQFLAILQHLKMEYLQNEARLQVLNREKPMVRPVEGTHVPVGPEEASLIGHVLVVFEALRYVKCAHHEGKDHYC